MDGPPGAVTSNLPGAAQPATQLDKCVRAHGNLYNACLGEARNRAQRIREHTSWKAARAMPRKAQEKQKARSAALAACNKALLMQSSGDSQVTE